MNKLLVSVELLTELVNELGKHTKTPKFIV